MKLFKTVWLVAAASLLWGCAEPAEDAGRAGGQPQADFIAAISPETLSAEAERGGELFAVLCADCHPRRGRGDYLKRIPATLLARRSEAELIGWIQEVKQHSVMPAFASLDQQQLEALAAYLAAEVTR